MKKLDSCLGELFPLFSLRWKIELRCCYLKMEGLADSFAAQFTVSSEPNDTAAPHPRWTNFFYFLFYLNIFTGEVCPKSYSAHREGSLRK